MIIDPRMALERGSYIYMPEWQCARSCSYGSDKCCLICNNSKFGCNGEDDKEHCTLEPEECGYSRANFLDLSSMLLQH